MTNDPYISNGQMTGNFRGNIDNMGDNAIKNDDYLKLGDLDIPSNDPSDFTVQISEKLINQAMQVLLGRNQIPILISQGQLAKNGYPLPWTTSTLNLILPGIVL